MPFVRFARDRRGYEHVYLVDVSKDRGRSRVLYWFRTPPGVKVGRNPFDPDTQRSLERQNPGVAFDWPQIVAARMPPPAPVENWREKRRVERAIKRARAADAVEVEGVDVEGVDVAEQTSPSDEPALETASGELLDELDDRHRRSRTRGGRSSGCAAALASARRNHLRRRRRRPGPSSAGAGAAEGVAAGLRIGRPRPTRAPPRRTDRWIRHPRQKNRPTKSNHPRRGAWHNQLL